MSVEVRSVPGQDGLSLPMPPQLGENNRPDVGLVPMGDPNLRHIEEQQRRLALVRLQEEERQQASRRYLENLQQRHEEWRQYLHVLWKRQLAHEQQRLFEKGKEISKELGYLDWRTGLNMRYLFYCRDPVTGKSLKTDIAIAEKMSDSLKTHLGWVSSEMHHVQKLLQSLA